jgi:hypothetical protein
MNFDPPFDWFLEENPDRFRCGWRWGFESGRGEAGFL